MKDLRDWHSVKNLYNKGVAIKQIARELNMSKNTVKSLIKKEAEPKYSREICTTKIDEYKDNIREWYLDKYYNFNGTRIYNELCKIGYEGNINPIYRYLSNLNEEKNHISKRATERFETPPGDQAQFDWGEYEMYISGEKISQLGHTSLAKGPGPCKKIEIKPTLEKPNNTKIQLRHML